MEMLLITAALFLAFGNGANDNFKGFATVWGADALSYRKALWLAAAATLAGSMLSLYLAQGLVQQFSGKGLLPQAVVAAPAFMVSVGIAAALSVILATRWGLPISTTHALIGGLVGAGWAASPGEVHLAQLGVNFLLPLLLSPVLAALLGLLTYRVLRLRSTAKDCACVLAPTLQMLPATGGAMLRVAGPQMVIAPSAVCDQHMQALARISITAWLNRLHIGSASLICFARAVNDTPKLAALLVATQVLQAPVSMVLVAVAMALGGLLFARRVAETMSLRVTRLDPTQGLAANLITSALVLGASQFGLPVSTTHVSVGSIAGVGANALNWHALRGVLLSWLATLPMAAGIAWLLMQSL